MQNIQDAGTGLSGLGDFYLYLGSASYVKIGGRCCISGSNGFYRSCLIASEAMGWKESSICLYA
jgi:hypothetical protein